jgi:hypothetical protein
MEDEIGCGSELRVGAATIVGGLIIRMSKRSSGRIWTVLPIHQVRLSVFSEYFVV